MHQRIPLLATIAAVTCLCSSHATSVSLYVDSAPNRYGSPLWAPWWDTAKADVADGTFVNLRTGTHPGTALIDPYDEIVYSTGDLGKRLHWIYWVPGENKANLAGRFEVKWVIDWDGQDWTYDWSTGNWAADAPEAGWVQPSGWEDYAGGVVGSLGFAWWSTDNDAPPFSTDSNLYNEVDQDDIDALRDLVLQSQTFAEGFVRIRDNANSDWQTYNLRVSVVPDGGSSLALMGLALVGLAGAYRRIHR